MFSAINIREIASAFVVLFAVIDIAGSVPIILGIKKNNQTIDSLKATFLSIIILISFLFIGEALLSLFGVDISSFAVAGSIVIFVLAIEMIFGIEVFKNDGPTKSATLVPITFPLIAGAGSLTTLLSLRAEYDVVNIIIAILLNMVIVYVVLRKVDIVEKIFGDGGVYVLRKFFGIILLAIAVKLFASNIASLLN
ncbi:MAG: MarC family protein [Bacteroidales bacterium]